MKKMFVNYSCVCMQYQPRKRSKTSQSINVPARPPATTSSSSSSSPRSTILTTIPLQSSIVTKEQPETPPPYLPQPSSSSSLTTTTASSSSTPSSSGNNSNDPISLLVATLFDQKLAMFASNFQQFNIDHLPYHLSPTSNQIYPTSTSMAFDPVVFLAKQQEHRLN